MISQTLISTSVLLLLASSAMADVPHTFQPNTPAKASEVNENFENLDSRIATVENLEESTCPETTDSTQVTATYTPVAAELGDRVNINGGDYLIAKFPFIVPSTGTKYAITLPVTFEENEGKITVFNSMSAVTGQTLDTCSDLYISEFQAVLTPITVGNSDRHSYTLNSRASGIANNTLTDTVTYVINAEVTEGNPGATMLSSRISRTSDISLNIAIEDAVLDIDVRVRNDSIPNSSESLCESNEKCEIEYSGYDFTAPTASMTMPAVNTAIGIDSFIDYMKIEKMD